MRFDPTLKFSTIYGHDPELKGAKYQQGVFIYDARHRCLNPTTVAPIVNPVEAATDAMIYKLTQKLEAAATELARTKTHAETYPTMGNKSKLTKATNKYESIKMELDGLTA